MLLRIWTVALAVAALAVLPGAAAARSSDRDHDRMPDKWERKHHLNPRTARDARRDPDHDGLKNRSEFKHRTNPRDADTDNDGVDDGDEVRTDNDPRDRDSDDDGIRDDDENAGQIVHFDATTGVLTIRTTDGTEVSGRVTDRTECKVDDEDEDESTPATGAARRGSDDGDDEDRGEDGDRSGPSDSSGPGPGGDEEHGDDRGDDEQEVSCTADQLTDGRPVHEAELGLEGGQAVWEEVELLPAA
jgi:hypothetical protein